MTWRDDPEIIWADGDGGDLSVWSDRMRTTGTYGSPEAILTPSTPAEQDEMLHRFAAVFGRRITGIEAVSEPIQVGDRVRVSEPPYGPADSTCVVRAIDDDVAFLRHILTNRPLVASLHRLTHADGQDEGIEPACRHRCLPSTSTGWCGAPDPDGNLECSLPKGHDGDHVACDRGSDTHDLAVWGEGSDPEPEIIEQGDLDDDEWYDRLTKAMDADDEKVERETGNGGWTHTRLTVDEMREVGPDPRLAYRIVVGGDPR